MKSTLFRCSRRGPGVRSTADQGAATTVAAVPGARRDVMSGRRPFRVIAGVVGAALLWLIGTGASSAMAGREEIDESRLVPALAPGWGEWRCNLRATGPVCSGERHQRTGWEESDLPCDVPLYSRFTSDRYQTRYYGHDYRQYFRKFRTTDLDEMSTSPEGLVTATIRSRSHFFQTFDVPGDDATRTTTTIGTLWDVRPVHGAPVLRVVGTAVEPHNGPATFSGLIITRSGTEHYQNVSLDVPIELFFDAACDATAH